MHSVVFHHLLKYCVCTCLYLWLQITQIKSDWQMTFFVRSSRSTAILCWPSVHFLLPTGADCRREADGGGVEGPGDEVSDIFVVPLRCFSFFSMFTKMPAVTALKTRQQTKGGTVKKKKRMISVSKITTSLCRQALQWTWEEWLNKYGRNWKTTTMSKMKQESCFFLHTHM